MTIKNECGGEEGKGGVGGVTSVLGTLPTESDKHHTNWPEDQTPFKNCHRRGKDIFEGRCKRTAGEARSIFILETGCGRAAMRLY